MVGGKVSDEKFCQSSVSDNDLILVRWKDETDGGWREGVVMCLVTRVTGQDTNVITNDIHREIANWQSWMRVHEHMCVVAIAILYDRHRHERAIVPLSKVQIVEPRCKEDCDTCGGTGRICVSKWQYRTEIRPHKMVKTTNMEPCLVCHGSGKLETFQN